MSLTVRDIATQYNITTAAVYQAAKCGHIESLPILSPIRFTKISVDAYWGRSRHNNSEAITTLNAFALKAVDKIKSLESRVTQLEQITKQLTYPT